MQSGLFLHYSPNANEGDYCLGEVDYSDLSDYTYQFKFAAVKGFGATYTIKGRNPAKFWARRENGWALEAQSTATNRDQWFEVEQLGDGTVKLRNSFRYSRLLNFDKTTVGGYVYIDKTSGAVFRLIKASDMTGIGNVKADDASAVTEVYTLDGVRQAQTRKGVNIVNGKKMLK